MKSVAIEREFGSGGRDIGIRIANKAQIPYYDGELLIEAAKGYGIELGTLKEFDENKVGSLLYNIAMMAGYNQYENMTKINEIFYGMKETIKNLYAEGPAVFIGRCSTEILKSCEDVVTVFVKCSDKEKRIDRVFEKEDVDTMQKARRMMERKDWGREKYFKFWTKKDWKDEKNYDLVLDTAKFSLEECVNILWKRMNELSI